MSRLFSRSSNSKGFTLIEAMVSISIIGLLLTVILRSQSSYTEATALTAVADDVAARLNEAQSYGIAVKEFTPGSDDFSVAYGLSISTDDAGDNLSYLFFGDRDGNDAYDGPRTCPTGGANECVDKTDIAWGNYIDSICILTTLGSDDCNAPRRADVVFVRPDTAAHITVWNAGGSTISSPNMSGVKYILKSPNGLSRSVAIYFSGQVSVTNP